MTDLYSRRHASPRDELAYEIPHTTRLRILHSIRLFLDERDDPVRFTDVLFEVGNELLKEYGQLNVPSDRLDSDNQRHVVEHFLSSPIDKALDFLEIFFRVRAYHGGHHGVEIVNNIFQEEGIGFELSQMTIVDTGKPAAWMGHSVGTIVETHYPQVIRKDSEFVHDEVVRPCLHVLGDTRLSTANSEMMSALKEYRGGNYAGTLTNACSAFESVLKTICDSKGWQYDSNRDTCGRLVSICKDNDLFPAFYVPTLEAIGTIRNRMGDAHGRGPDPSHEVEKSHADHILHLTATNILFLTRMASF